MSYNHKALFIAHTTCPVQEDRRALLNIDLQGSWLKGQTPPWTLSVVSQQERDFCKVSHQQLNTLPQNWHMSFPLNLSELGTWPQPTITVRKYNPTKYLEGRDLGISVEQHTDHPNFSEGSNVLFLYTVWFPLFINGKQLAITFKSRNESPVTLQLVGWKTYILFNKCD